MNLGMPEMLFIFVLALLIFGPKKMPEIGRQVGKALGEFRRASNQFKSQLDSEVRKLEVDEKRQRQTRRAANEIAGDLRAAPIAPLDAGAPEVADTVALSEKSTIELASPAAEPLSSDPTPGVASREANPGNG